MKRIMLLLLAVLAAIFLSACGKTASVSDEITDVEISSFDEITFSVTYSIPDAVTYTVSSTEEGFLWYEGHQFAIVQKLTDNGWCSLEYLPRTTTGDFQGKFIPVEGFTETIGSEQSFGGKLDKGTYRLLACCYRSADDLFASESPVYIAAEFTID
jgi:hypothetical protein